MEKGGEPMKVLVSAFQVLATRERLLRNRGCRVYTHL